MSTKRGKSIKLRQGEQGRRGLGLGVGLVWEVEGEGILRRAEEGDTRAWLGESGTGKGDSSTGVLGGDVGEGRAVGERREVA